MTVAALPTSGIDATTRPAAMIQKVTQPSRTLANGASSERLKTNGKKPQMKKVVNTSALRTPWIERLW
jgi:hypothetical protein